MHIHRGARERYSGIARDDEYYIGVCVCVRVDGESSGYIAKGVDFERWVAGIDLDSAGDLWGLEGSIDLRV